MIIVGSDSAPGVGDFIIRALDVQTQIWPMTLWKMGQFCCYHRPAPIWSALCRGTVYTYGKETASEESLHLPWNSALRCFWGSHSAVVKSWGKSALLRDKASCSLFAMVKILGSQLLAPAASPHCKYSAGESRQPSHSSWPPLHLFPGSNPTLHVNALFLFFAANTEEPPLVLLLSRRNFYNIDFNHWGWPLE